MNKIEELSITPTILSNNGYKKFIDTIGDKDFYVESWQKCVRNEHGKAYFINFNFNNLSKFYHDKDIINPYSWEACLQFESMEEDMTINVKVFASNNTLIKVEDFCEKMFNKMQFRNYEYYDDNDEKNHKKKIKEQEVIENTNILNNVLDKKEVKEIKKKI